MKFDTTHFLEAPFLISCIHIESKQTKFLQLKRKDGPGLDAVRGAARGTGILCFCIFLPNLDMPNQAKLFRKRMIVRHNRLVERFPCSHMHGNTSACQHSSFGLYKYGPEQEVHAVLYVAANQKICSVRWKANANMQMSQMAQPHS